MIKKLVALFSVFGVFALALLVKATEISGVADIGGYGASGIADTIIAFCTSANILYVLTPFGIGMIIYFVKRHARR